MAAEFQQFIQIKNPFEKKALIQSERAFELGAVRRILHGVLGEQMAPCVRYPNGKQKLGLDPRELDRGNIKFARYQ